MTNIPGALSEYTKLWLEYPYTQSVFGVSYFDDTDHSYDGLTYEVFTNASQTRIAGPYEKVLFVIANTFQNNTDLVISIGEGAGLTNLTLNANGINGAAVDIDPALFSTLSDNFANSSTIVQNWLNTWFNERTDVNMADDFVACCTHSLPLKPAKFGGNLAGALISFVPGHVPAWNHSGYANPLTNTDAVLLITSYTRPDDYKQYTTVDLQGYSGCVKQIPSVNFTAVVMRMWGAYDYVNKHRTPTKTLIANLARMKALARITSTIFDTILEATSFSASELYNIPSLDITGGGKSLTLWKQVFKTMNESYHKRYDEAYCNVYRPENYNDLDLGMTGYYGNRMVSPLRKPISERMYYCNNIEFDKSWIIKPFSTQHTITRTNTSVPPIVPFSGF
jgi:hypothetical protein